MSEHIDILMITYNRPEYTRLSLTRLLETCDESTRVWLWHNGEHGETLEVVKSLVDHPRVHEFRHSKENKKLREPTNWLWQNAKGEYLSKVDDDCLVPHGWAQKLRAAHIAVPEFGIIACWHFREEDILPAGVRKVRRFAGQEVMQNLWVGGSGYLMKRAARERVGILANGQSFTAYCVEVTKAGWINGWYYPFLLQEHMDDPRSPHSLLKTDEDLTRYMPLSAETNGVTTVAAWQAQLCRSAQLVQEVSPDRIPTWTLRGIGNRAWRKLKRVAGHKQQW
jgi:glycosyltransferase involved in cell wall biosynthesis